MSKARNTENEDGPVRERCSLFCGWGRVLFAQTFSDTAAVAHEVLEERKGDRDIAAYVRDPHVVLSFAPQRLFLDPSDMLRLDLNRFDDAPLEEAPLVEGIEIRPVRHKSEARAINDLYLKRDMVASDSDFIWRERDSDKFVFLVAVDVATQQVVGTVTGLDHVAIFDDSDQGSSLWCLAVSPTAVQPGIGESLVVALAAFFRERGRTRMDLSVIHDNHQAKKLYSKLGFYPVQVFSVKTKNAHNEALFMGPELEQNLNPYARIIVDEARARGIHVDVLDDTEGYFRLSRGGKSVVCRESLSEMTTAIAMSRCQDKYATHRWLGKAGLRTPDFQLAGSEADNLAFLKQKKRIVVKPVVGEQGNGITVGVETADAMASAIEFAGTFSERVLLESFHAGEDLRIVAINFAVVAAAVRRPAHIVGDGCTSAEVLIAKQSRRREAATSGESRIPIDEETRRCLEKAGYNLQSPIPKGTSVTVRRTANLHTGGTIHDVTPILDPTLAEVAEQAARRLDIPVVGLDLIVPAADQSEYVIIEANERPGLANHEPQPTAERFVDLLFPLSVPAMEATDT